MTEQKNSLKVQCDECLHEYEKYTRHSCLAQMRLDIMEMQKLFHHYPSTRDCNYFKFFDILDVKKINETSRVLERYREIDEKRKIDNDPKLPTDIL